MSASRLDVADIATFALHAPGTGGITIAEGIRRLLADRELYERLCVKRARTSRTWPDYIDRLIEYMHQAKAGARARPTPDHQLNR